MKIHNELEINVLHLFAIYSGGYLDLSETSNSNNQALGIANFPF